MGCNILKLTKSNVLSVKKFFFFLEKNILKCEHNCQNDDVTNRFLNICQQSRQDVLRNSMSIFTEKKFIYINKTLHIGK